MNGNPSLIPWVLQSNVGPIDDVDSYWKAIKARNNPRFKVSASPFLNDLDEFTREYEQSSIAGVLAFLRKHGIQKNSPVVWMGGIGFIEAVRKAGWNNWIFTDTEMFNVRKYSEMWGDRMLNSEGKFTTMGGFLDLPGPPDELVFVRPLKDRKEFPGKVIERINFRKWVSTIQGRGFNLDENCEIYVGPPHGISAEWRMFMVEGKYVTGSFYTSEKYGPEGYAPPREVIEYAEECAKIWSPAPLFCLDICRTAGNLYIVEAGSIHSCGLYRSSAAKIVEAVSSFFEDREKSWYTTEGHTIPRIDFEAEGYDLTKLVKYATKSIDTSLYGKLEVNNAG